MIRGYNLPKPTSMFGLCLWTLVVVFAVVAVASMVVEVWFAYRLATARTLVDVLRYGFLLLSFIVWFKTTETKQ